MKVVDQMKLFMEPKSLAIIGVSRHTGKNSFNILENFINHGFSGDIYPVNPHSTEILGVKTYPRIKDIPGEIDLAVISTPRPIVLGIVQECIEKNIKAIVIVTQGFADADEDGRALQDKIVHIARENGARIIGPNSFGVANAFIRLNTAFVPFEMEEIPVGVICQSGLFFQGLPNFILTGKAIQLGNCSDIGFTDALEYFETDREIEIILLHIEGIVEGRKFLEVARRVAKKKKIIVLKTGKSRAGAEAAQSHTGSLAGRDEVYNAVFEQCGIIRVNNSDKVVNILKALHYLPPMRGRRIAVATVVYGAAAIAVDACEEYDLKMATLSPQTIQRIADLAPTWLTVANPVDLGGLNIRSMGMKTIMERVIHILLADSQVDALFFIGPAGLTDIWDCLNIIPQAAQDFKNKPVVSWLYGPYQHKFATKLEAARNSVVFPTCEMAIWALSKLCDSIENQ